MEANNVKAISTLGLDLSLCETGFCLLVGSNVLSGVIKTKKTINRFERYSQILESILAITEKHKIDLIVLEGYAFAAQGRIADLAELGGIIRYTLQHFGFKTIDVPPKTLKKWTSGNGNSDKQAMMKAVKERWQVDFDNDNACDAYALAQYGRVPHDTEVKSKKCKKRNSPNNRRRGVVSKPRVRR